MKNVVKLNGHILLKLFMRRHEVLNWGQKCHPYKGPHEQIFSPTGQHELSRVYPPFSYILFV
jgi:hypothetical protein